jgi:hypothetical protein
MSVIDDLRQAIAQSGRTNEELGRAAKVHPNIISAINTGRKKRLASWNQRRLAAELGYDLVDDGGTLRLRKIHGSRDDAVVTRDDAGNDAGNLLILKR